MTRVNLVCTGPELARDPARPRFQLEADLACDSPRVENQWAFRDRVYVEWTISIDEGAGGYWAPVRVAGDDAIPEDTFLELVRCRREHRLRDRWTPDKNPAAFLDPGLYRLRWYGPMDGAAQLDLELGGPCDTLAQDCESDERCIAPGVCVPKR